MFDSPILDTAIALVFVYFLLSTLVTGITEFISFLLRERGKMLRYALNEVLDDRHNVNYAELLYSHPQLDLLKRRQSSLPENLPAPQFATGIMDLIGENDDRITFEVDPETKLQRQVTQRTADPVQRFRNGLARMNYSDLKVLLQSLLDRAGGDAATLEQLKASLEGWFNNYMQEVSAWYRRKIRLFIVGAAAVVTLFLNVNSIRLVTELYSDEALREPLVEAAVKAVEEDHAQLPGDASVQQRLDTLQAQLARIRSFNLPIGWKQEITGQAPAKPKPFQWLFTILGYTCTTIALTMGAPFWFDALKRLVSVRKPKQDA